MISYFAKDKTQYVDSFIAYFQCVNHCLLNACGEAYCRVKLTRKANGFFSPIPFDLPKF